MMMNYNPDALKQKGEEFRIKINGMDFAFEKRLFAKIQLMCDRITKGNKDAFLINEGYEGDGKTNSSLVEGIVAQSLLKEKFKDTSIHLFFRTSSCIEFAKTTRNKIIILDEPSLESLSTDSLNALNKDLLRLVSMMRMKGHYFILNMTKFWKFPEFLMVDRALGMIHMDTKNNKSPGKFIYVRQKNLERLWNDKKKKNKRNYHKYLSFGGRMPLVMPDVFDKFKIQVEQKLNASYDDYEEQKEKSIESIGNKEKNMSWDKKRLNELQYKIATLWKRIPKITQGEIAVGLNTSSSRLREWATMLKPLEISP